MKRNPLVSVIISVYRENVELVSQAINSIRDQTYKNLEIIVLLDCPENVAVRMYLQKIEMEEGRLSLIINEKNLGLVNSLNKGISYSRGEYICRMDADDISEKYRIEKQLNFLITNNLDIVGSFIELIGMNNELIGEGRKYPVSNKYIYEYMRYASPIPHPTWLSRREVYTLLDGYRNIPYVEDYDFLVRALMYNIRMGVLPEKMLKYRINRKGITQKNIAIQKILSEKIVQQVKRCTVIDENEIINSLNSKRVKSLEKYYMCGKALKAGDRVSLNALTSFIFNLYNIKEIVQRVICKLIIYKDRNYGNY